MQLPAPLLPAVFRERLNRFTAAVELPGGVPTLAHVPNSGRLTGCAVPGARCWLAPAGGRGRRLPYRLELMEAPGGALVGVNTQRSNGLALEALDSGLLGLPRLARPYVAQRERSPGPGLRIDLLLTDEEGPYWVEVKNITLVEEGVGLFPDAVTARGRRHLERLAEIAREGGRAAVVYVVQRDDARAVRAAAEVDPGYAAAAERAARSGVAFAAIAVQVRLDALVPRAAIPVLVPPSGRMEG
jgi:sugar fermentation stimulation protein A